MRYDEGMTQVEVLQDPLRIQAAGSTRAGLIVAALKGLFQSANVEYPLEGDESTREFQIEAESAPQLILSVLRQAAALATEYGEMYAEVSFSLITDKKATGSFVGRALGSKPTMPAITSIDGEIVKGDDGMWRATIALA